MKADGAAVEPRKLKSCGFLLFRKGAKDGDFEFLLLKHGKRYDLAKGHQEGTETDQQTALRELREETGVPESKIVAVPAETFHFTETYTTPYKRFGGALVEKTIVIFICCLVSPVTLKLTEHKNCEWCTWTSPPAKIQRNTIDPLLKEIHLLTKKKGCSLTELFTPKKAT
eukprot:TRINITY_DN6396_c0_g1_i1.p1 TRINITY_DN6396_c0_g1~~TRINITY_DN6396_c0_g1_i1.p1  ORF type:complete len:170 (-),score=4.93 TRINITY_DN6396_c0_g1_i1:49-558(-)